MSRRGSVRVYALLGGALALATAPLGAQTDYYNTDRGRPLRVEDAHPVERHAFELQLAPVRLEREDGGRYGWELEPELAYGILPGTHVEIGFPVRFVDAGGTEGTGGLGGLELSALHNLNTETRTLPAFALAADLALPVGPMAGERTYAGVRGIATRTFRSVRVHLNAAYTLGGEPGEAEEVGETTRWMAGLAVDRALPLRSLLLTGGAVVEQPLREEDPRAGLVEAGIRYQTSPQFNLDLGVGRRLWGEERGWHFTFGLAHAFAVRSLMPGR